jgi:hypothetical protein
MMELAEYYKRRSEKKPKKNVQLGPTKHHTTRFEKKWKNSKQFRIPTKNKDSKRFSGQ